jgi:hypothetical protein
VHGGHEVVVPLVVALLAKLLHVFLALITVLLLMFLVLPVSILCRFLVVVFAVAGAEEVVDLVVRVAAVVAVPLVGEAILAGALVVAVTRDVEVAVLVEAVGICDRKLAQRQHPEFAEVMQITTLAVACTRQRELMCGHGAILTKLQAKRSHESIKSAAHLSSQEQHGLQVWHTLLTQPSHVQRLVTLSYLLVMDSPLPSLLKPSLSYPSLS